MCEFITVISYQKKVLLFQINGLLVYKRNAKYKKKKRFHYEMKYEALFHTSIQFVNNLKTNKKFL